MAASVPPLAGRVVALKTKASSFEVRNKQISLIQPVGFSPNFGKGGEDGREHAEQETARVTQELYKLLEPVLEEQFPCHLRLMGVRVSSFRDQRATLDKGQQLISFFQSKGSEQQEGPTAGAGPDNLNTGMPKPQIQEANVIDLDSSQEDQRDKSRDPPVQSQSLPKGCLKRVVERLASRRAKRIRLSGVCCPVCGVRVPEDQANRHVNAHYGDQ